MKNHLKSKLCLGCWSFGGNKDTYWGAQDAKNADEIVEYAIGKDYAFFDTAAAYNDGMSEIALGKSLARFDRELYAVNTKIALNEGSNIERELLGSLERLGLDYLDLYMIHWPPARLEQDARSIVEEFERLKQRGLIRNYGVSNFGVDQLGCVLNEGFQPFINQLPYNLVSRAIEFELMSICQKYQIRIMAYMVLLQGVLSGKYKATAQIPANRRRTRHFNCVGNPDIRHGEAGQENELWEILSILQDWATELNVSPSLLATCWCLQAPALQTVIIGVRTLEQLKAGIAAVEYSIPEHIYTALSTASESIKQKLGKTADLWQSQQNTRTF